MNQVRIAVTGVGMVTPFGVTRDASWQGLLSGRSAVTWLDDRLPFNPPSKPREYFGATVPWTPETDGRLVPFARRAASEAVTQARLCREALREAACVIGTSKIDMPLFDEFARPSESTSSSANGFTLWNTGSPSAAVEAVAADWGCEGGAICPVAACATGLISIHQAATLIRQQNCSVAIAGSADAALHPGLLSSYKRLGVHAKAGDDPAKACRPLDRTRNGFAVGEGAACLVLEEWNHAQQRGATILAEWLGGRIASDPSGLTLVNDDGQTLFDVVTRLLNDLQLTPADLSCISLHGTATKLNDRSEARTFNRLFEKERRTVPAFGLKGAIGHLMGAAGSVETAASVLSLQQQIVPPTCNHHQPEEQNRISLCQSARPTRLSHLLKVSLGFGGHVVAGVLKRVD